MEPDPVSPIEFLTRLIVLVLCIVSLIHVGWQSSHDKRIGNTFWHVGMNLLVCWPLPYLCWILWWPGSVRQYLFGNDRDKARQWARAVIEEKKRSRKS